MKKVLLATTMLVAGASIAAAEVTLSGDARMGIIKTGNDNALTLNTDESAVNFTSRARVTFTMSAESDSGLSYGASFRADNATAAAGGTAGSVFISGAFGKLSMGDVDGAAQMATGHVAGVGLTGLGDLNESSFIGAGGAALVAQAVVINGGTNNPVETNDPTLLFEYSAGAFTGYFSITSPADVLVNAAAPGAPAANTLASNAQAMAVGGKYTFGDYTVGLGYEKLSGFIEPAAGPGILPGVAVPADNTDLKHIVVSGSAVVSGVTLKALYGKASGTLAGGAVDGKQYAASASYTSGAITGTVFYTDDSALNGTTAYGLGASYDLGGGAKVVGGMAKSVSGTDATSYDLGVSFTF